MKKKFARCAKCHHFFHADKVAAEDCPSCTYHTSRCKDCGGVDGVRRSLMAHHSWYRTRGHGVGGHDKYVNLIVDRIMRRLTEVGYESERGAA